MARFAPKNTLPALGGLLGAALLIGYAPAAAEGAMRGLSACGRVILPAVFPFLAVSVFLAGAPGGAGLAALLSGVMRYCFRLPAAAAPALLMSWIGGYPAGAKTLAELRRQGALTARETEEAAPVLIYSGPAYMAGVVGGRIFGSTVVGIFLFLCQLAAGLLLGRLFAWGRPLPPKGSRLRSSPKTEPAAVLLVRSVGSAASSAVNICAFVVLLSAFAEVFSACGLFPLLERGVAFLTRGGIAGEVAHCFFTGLLEICAGSALAAELPPTEAGKILPFLLSFGGLSVCCQVSACFGEEPLSWGKLLWGRLLHGLFTALLAVPWLKRAVLPAMTGAAVPAFSVGRMLWGSGAMVLLCLLLTVGLLIGILLLPAIVSIEVNYFGKSADDMFDLTSAYFGDEAATELKDVYYDYAVENPFYFLEYAMGYSIYQQKLREAEDICGASFDLRSFHETYLNIGPTYFNISMPIMDEWISEHK